ncbi:MAG: hypothetical protein ACPGSO_03850 [Vicingaceae bacterium]
MNKKIIIYLVICFFSVASANAQAFQKGTKVISLGIGFAGYGTTQTITTNFNGVSISNSESDGAASTVIPIQFEYGISNKFGLGAELSFNNYFINDSDKVVLESVKSVDFGITGSYHLLNSEKNDLFFTLGLGGSSMSVNYVVTQAQFIESLSGSGSYFTIGITDRIFFSDNFGVFFNLAYRGYNYTGLEAEFTPAVESAIASSNFTYSQSWDWKFTGVHFGTGLAFKF